MSFFLFSSAGWTWWSLEILSCHHSGTSTPTLFHIFLLYHSSLCWYTTSLPATSINNLEIKPTLRCPITAPPGRGTSGTSASWICPPLALAGTGAPGWTGNVWRGRWCSLADLRHSCPPHWSPGARGTGPGLAARRTRGAPEYGGPERQRSPDTDSCRGQRLTWPLREEVVREDTRLIKAAFKFIFSVTSVNCVAS